jgi:hypothetical protein
MSNVITALESYRSTTDSHDFSTIRAPLYTNYVLALPAPNPLLFTESARLRTRSFCSRTKGCRSLAARSGEQ